MSYSSLIFVFFAIFVVLVFYSIPQKGRVPWLCLSSFAWYSTWKWQWALALFAILITNYVSLRWILSCLPEKRKKALVGLLLANIAVFIFLKIGGPDSWAFGTPYGSSFFMFMIFAYIADLMRAGINTSSEKIENFILMPSFFPLLMGGPIERGRHFFPQLNKSLDFHYENIVDGVLIFTYGFLKKNALARVQNLPTAADVLFYVTANPAMLLAIGLIKTFQAYIDFSSYCDMGRGVAKCFGINLSINFRPILFSKNPNDFWQRWNITLGTWIRDYISFPLMLNWGRTLNQSFILFCSFVVVGLWHGFTLNWLAFGIFNGSMIILFNWTQKKIKIRKWGYLFTIALFIGNGLLQQGEILEVIVHSLTSPVVAQPSFLFLNRSFYGLLAVVFIMDFLQEWKKDVDWYTKFPNIFKVSILVLIMGVFFGTLEFGVPVDVNDSPPVYFKI